MKNFSIIWTGKNKIMKQIAFAENKTQIMQQVLKMP
jgi:hypothetical protein